MSNTNRILTHNALANIGKVHPRIHAKELDRKLGYRVSRIEVKLLQKYSRYDRVIDESNRKQHYQGTQTWIGLHPQVLQTPYCDIYHALSLITDIKIEHVIDIGAGYGRVGIVLSVLYPNARFTGFEILKQRQSEGNRVFKNLGILNSNLELKNVLENNFSIPIADVYFIYDFSEKEDIDFILQGISESLKGKECYLIIRGDRVDHLINNKFNHSWRYQLTVPKSDLKLYKSKMLDKE